jgi:hypothetical protein
MEEDYLKKNYPLGYSYLAEFQSELKEIRTRQKTNSKYWYSCHRSRDMNIFEGERIVTPEISFGCNMTISPAGIYHNTKVYSIVPKKERPENIKYWIGLLNSRILWWYLTKTGYVLRGGYFVFKTNYLKPFPIHTIDFSNPSDVAHHDLIVSLVEKMLDLHNQFASSKMEHEKTMLSRQIQATDAQIDTLVYELYGLTEEEITIVEGG